MSKTKFPRLENAIIGFAEVSVPDYTEEGSAEPTVKAFKYATWPAFPLTQFREDPERCTEILKDMAIHGAQMHVWELLGVSGETFDQFTDKQLDAIEAIADKAVAAGTVEIKWTPHQYPWDKKETP